MKRRYYDEINRLEVRLRAERPTADDEFVDGIVARASLPAPREQARRPRFALSVAFAVVVLVGLAATGGVGYATSSVSQAARSATNLVSPSHNSSRATHASNNTKNTLSTLKSSGSTQSFITNGNHGSPSPPWGQQYGHWVTICYPFTKWVWVPSRERHHFNWGWGWQNGGHWEKVTDWRTIVVWSTKLGDYVPPGKLGACHR